MIRRFDDLIRLAGISMHPRKGEGGYIRTFIFVASYTRLQVNIWRMERCTSGFTCAGQIKRTTV